MIKFSFPFPRTKVSTHKLMIDGTVYRVHPSESDVPTSFDVQFNEAGTLALVFQYPGAQAEPVRALAAKSVVVKLGVNSGRLFAIEIRGASAAIDAVLRELKLALKQAESGDLRAGARLNHTITATELGLVDTADEAPPPAWLIEAMRKSRTEHRRNST